MATEVGILVGLVLGLTGAGGSIFAVPLFMLLLGLPINDAIGISLGAVAASAFVGILIRSSPFKSTSTTSLNNSQHSSTQALCWAPGLYIAIAGIITAPLGRWLGGQTNELFLLITFSVLANILAIRMWRTASSDQKTTYNLRSTPMSIDPEQRVDTRSSLKSVQRIDPDICSHANILALDSYKYTHLLVPGFAIGLLSGFLGVGGGFLIVPLLTLHLHMAMQTAVGTSLIVICLVSASGFLAHLIQVSSVPLDLLFHTSTGSVTGILLGTLIAEKIAGPQLQKLFAMSVLAIITITLSRTLI